MKQVALNIAETAFAGKKDRAGAPYLGHLKRVANNVLKYIKNEDRLEELEIVALLHDLLEDCPEWKKEHLTAIFRDIAITDAIDRLTKKPNQTYEKYINDVAGNQLSKVVKLADLEDNMNITRLTVLNDEDTERLKKYHKAYNFLLGKGNLHNI